MSMLAKKSQFYLISAIILSVTIGVLFYIYYSMYSLGTDIDVLYFPVAHSVSYGLYKNYIENSNLWTFNHSFLYKIPVDILLYRETYGNKTISLKINISGFKKWKVTYGCENILISNNNRISSGLVLYIREKGGNLTDLSGNNYNIVLNNVESIFYSGKYYFFFNKSKNSYLKINQLNLPQDFTLIIDFAIDNESEGYFLNSNVFTIYYSNGTFQISNGTSIITFNTPIIDYKTTELAIVNNGGYTYVYLDGILKTKSNLEISSGTFDVTFFNISGTLRRIYLYDKPFSDTQIYSYFYGLLPELEFSCVQDPNFLYINVTVPFTGERFKRIYIYIGGPVHTILSYLPATANFTEGTNYSYFVEYSSTEIRDFYKIDYDFIGSIYYRFTISYFMENNTIYPYYISKEQTVTFKEYLDPVIEE